MKEVFFLDLNLRVDRICLSCGWYDSDFGCKCPPDEKWYQCDLEPEPDWDEFMADKDLHL